MISSTCVPTKVSAKHAVRLFVDLNIEARPPALLGSETHTQ
jgi:hypothetical protein